MLRLQVVALTSSMWRRGLLCPLSASASVKCQVSSHETSWETPCSPQAKDCHQSLWWTFLPSLCETEASLCIVEFQKNQYFWLLAGLCLTILVLGGSHSVASPRTPYLWSLLRGFKGATEWLPWCWKAKPFGQQSQILALKFHYEFLFLFWQLADDLFPFFCVK